MKNYFSFFLLVFILSFGLNKNGIGQEKLYHNNLEKAYNSLLIQIDSIGKVATYKEIIPVLEAEYHKFKDSPLFVAKLNLTLAEYHLLNNLIAGSESSLDKSIHLFEKVLMYNEQYDFFVNELSIPKRKVDLAIQDWKKANNHVEKNTVLIKVLIKKFDNY
jgi:hypothetical protein